MTETHVVVYCDDCGELYADPDDESICFDSKNQAIAYLAALPVGIRWVYDGDTIICRDCHLSGRSTDRGLFPENEAF
ncbi:hypothetical protein [Nocardia sp. NPDC057353]|uniref:hypothetical protein n=1 Tax=Nocardia sp. NPDC057353 TaxID=3346104 RepID=UPI003641844E